MDTLVPKLIKLAMRQRIELTQQEVAGLELAGELIYRRERLEGNFMRQGIGAGVMRGDWAESKPVTEGWGGTPVRPRRSDHTTR
jgi:hypothetical protein